METLTPEQQKDVAQRVKDAHSYLESKDLSVACQIAKENIGNDVFADKLYPYLQDIKYSGKSVKSPLQKDELNKKD